MFPTFVIKARPELLPQNSTQNQIALDSVHSNLILLLLLENASGLLNSELKKFIKVRSKHSLKKQNEIVYSNVPSNKDQLLRQCVELKGSVYLDQLFEMLAYPMLLIVV